MQYFGYFAAGLPVAAVLFFSFWRSRARTVRLPAFIAFGVAFVAAVAYALGTAGRGNIGFVFLALLITWLNLDQRGVTVKKAILVVIFAVFIFFLVTYGKSAIWTLGALSGGVQAYIDAFISHREWYSSAAGTSGLVRTLIDLLRNMDHALVSVYTSMHFVDAYQVPRLFFDWPRAFVELIPGVSQPEFVVSQTPSGLNRDFLDADGYVPPGWIAMKLINGGFPWLILGTFIAAFLGGYLNRLLWATWRSSPMLPGVFTVIAFFWKDHLLGPDPFMVVMSNVPLMVLAVCLGWMLVLQVGGPVRVVERSP